MSFSGGDDIQLDENIVTVKNTTRTTMVVTASIKKDITDEVNKAVETHAKSINKENCNEIFAFREHKGDIVWSVKMCDRCNRPTLVHADPWGDRCLITGEPVTQNVVAKYLDQLNSHKRLKQIVVWVMPDIEQYEEEEDDNPPRSRRNYSRNSRKDKNTHNKHHKFPFVDPP